jgi:hypothetical protein
MLALLFFLLLVATPEVSIDPTITYTGGIDTSALSLRYTSGGISTNTNKLAYTAGGISTNTNKLAYTAGGISTKANKLSYILNCFIYVNNSWYALRIKAKLDDGTPISVPVTVNGTSYTVPTSGLLLNWSTTAPICGYLDPIATVSFPPNVDRYVLKSVEGVNGNTAIWPPFTIHNVTAIYTTEQTAPPLQPSQPLPGGSGEEHPLSPSESSSPKGYITIPWRLIQFVTDYWWLLILTAMLIIAAYVYHKRHSGVSVEINIPNWAVRGR